MTVEEMTKAIQRECELAHLRMREREYYMAPLDRGYEACVEWMKTDPGQLMYLSRWCSLAQLLRDLEIPEDPTIPERVKADELIRECNDRMFAAMPQEGDRA